MKILFRLSKNIEGFSTMNQTKNFFRTLKIEYDNYFYNNKHISEIKKNDLIYFAYDSYIVAKAIFTGLSLEIDSNKNYFYIGYKLKDIEVIDSSHRLNAKIVGTRSIRYLKNKKLEEEVMRVLDINIKQIADEINTRAKNYEIGSLQEIRKNLHHLNRLPSKHIFTNATISDQWAFHVGGRTELQFNIGSEIVNNKSMLRFGVAFSLELSQSLPSVKPLIPKIELFNDYIQENMDEFSDMKMWYYDGGRSSEYNPTYISDELVKENVFIFLGMRQPMDAIDYDLVLSTMDRLLPLYLFIENKGYSQTKGKKQKFIFTPGHRKKTSETTANVTKKKLDIKLRHNEIQQKLYEELVSRFGEDNVGTEISSGYGNSVDLIVRYQDEYLFYEIKTAHSAKSCIRQAIGQLLEYSYWPNNQEASSIIVVGEPYCDEEAKVYLKTLREKFALPIKYQSVNINE